MVLQGCNVTLPLTGLADRRNSIIHPLWVRTPLIEALVDQDGFPKKILLADDVAKSIVKIVLSGEGTQVLLPELNLASLVRGFPTWMQERTRDKQAKVIQYAVQQ